MTVATSTHDRINSRVNSHTPVQLAEVIRQLNPQPGETIVDGTFGAGGYSHALLEKGANVIGIDRDPSAIEGGRSLSLSFSDRLTLINGKFSDLDRIANQLGIDHVDGVVLDLGVSSMQLDTAERGFSFLKDGPLDMRMDQSGPSASEIVNSLAVKDLIRIIGVLGEERQASAVANAIDKARKRKSITRTAELAGIVESVVGRGKKARIHPATRTFQGLRIYVNSELKEISQALTASECVLKEGGRLVVISFHSLEDRIVKRFLADRAKLHSGGSRHLPEESVPPPTFSLPSKRALKPNENEISANPRSRSSRMRVGLRTGAPAREVDPSVFGIPHMPKFKELGGN